jgi:type II secretory pathway component GspD/PulD (secretin)
VDLNTLLDDPSYRLVGISVRTRGELIGDKLMRLSVVTEKSRYLQPTLKGVPPQAVTQRFSVTGELEEGQSLAMSCHGESRYSAESAQVPLLSDIPVIGRAISSKTTLSKTPIRLLCIVTPTIAEGQSGRIAVTTDKK